MLKGYFYKKEKKNPGEPGSGNQDGAARPPGTAYLRPSTSCMS